MAKTLNQLGEATDLDTPDLLLARDTSTGDDKRITLNNSRFSRHGQTESVTLSTGTLTIPVGMSTIKLPTTVWDGNSNITISAIAFEGGVQPAVGYEFSVVVPKTTTAGSLTAGALGNEVLIQDGASIAVEANNNADLPCYPNAADNPDQDAVQFAAPYYRLDFRVDSYDGSGNPVVSLVGLPGAVEISNDNGSAQLSPIGGLRMRISTDAIDWTTSGSVPFTFPVSISGGRLEAEGGFAGMNSGGPDAQTNFESIDFYGIDDTSWFINVDGTGINSTVSSNNFVSLHCFGRWY